MYHLLVGMQWYINSEKTSAQIKLQHNIKFHGLQNLCNSPFNDFYSKGVGAAVENTTSNFTWWTATVGQWYTTNRHSSRPSQLCFLLQQQKKLLFPRRLRTLWSLLSSSATNYPRMSQVLPWCPMICSPKYNSCIMQTHATMYCKYYQLQVFYTCPMGVLGHPRTVCGTTGHHSHWARIKKLVEESLAVASRKQSCSPVRNPQQWKRDAMSQSWICICTRFHHTHKNLILSICDQCKNQ